MVDAGVELTDWIGRTEEVADGLSPWPARAASAMLNQTGAGPGEGDALPPLWHWFYFLACVPQSKLSPDGHPERGAFLPPVQLPRRMFAGARMRFIKPLLIGQSATRRAMIRNVTSKSGHSGELAFVTVGYELRQNGELCIEEEQDIVYREVGAPVPAPQSTVLEPVDEGHWSRTFESDPRLLFRFSALTFNAHRIHYDRSYAQEEEGYPGLIVHGPLTAVLLADLVARNSERRIEAFSFRGKAPLFDLAPFRLVGKPIGDRVELEVQGPDGGVTQTAIAELASSA